MAGKVFVTGATGFIGTRLVQKLVGRGCAVRALSRRAEPPPPPDTPPGQPGPLQHPLVEIVRGDITDRESLRRGVEGCDRVFHLAAYAKNFARDPRTYFDQNVQGMRNVFDAAAAAGVARVVWTSTCVTLGATAPGAIADEDTPRFTDRYYTEYEETKAAAEREAQQRAAAGFPVVIVNPTRVFGPGHLTEGNSLTRLIDDYDRGRFPFLPNFGRNIGNWVLVDDVAEGHILAMERGQIGHRYLLGGENASLKQFLDLVNEVSGRRHLRIPLGKLLPLAFSGYLKLQARLLGIYPAITPGWVRTFTVDWAYRCDKAVRELGYRPTPLREGIRITYEWLVQLRQQRSRKAPR